MKKLAAFCFAFGFVAIVSYNASRDVVDLAIAAWCTLVGLGLWIRAPR